MAALKVLISGGGVAGTSLAFWLTKLGHNVTVAEHFPSLRTTGLQIDLRGRGIEVLRRMGLEKAFREHAAPEEGGGFVDSKGRKRAYFGANKTGKGSQSFTSEFEIMRGDLCRIIHDATTGAKYIFGTSVASYKNTGSGVDVVFKNGETDTFDLMVGTDGVWSSTRKMMLGNEQAAAVWHSLHESAAYLTFPDPIKPGETYDATFYIATDKRTILLRRHNDTTRQLYLLLNRDDERLQKVTRGDVEAEKAAFKEIFADAGWRAPELLKQMQYSEDFYCERLGVVKSDVWSQGRVALLGDAAFAPGGSGMGTSCAMIAAYVLAGELSRSASEKTENIKVALKRYDETFRPFVDLVQKGADNSAFKWLMPSSRFGIEVFHLITTALMWLKIDMIVKFFMIETEEKWKLPEYEALREVEGEIRCGEE